MNELIEHVWCHLILVVMLSFTAYNRTHVSINRNYDNRMQDRIFPPLLPLNISSLAQPGAVR